MYNQKYHKFDNFYNHKFGFHITGPRQDAFEAVFRLKPKVVKTLDFSVDVMKRIRAEIPDVFLIGRLFVHPQDFGQMSGNTAEAARRKGIEMADRILREEVNQDRHHINGKPIFHAWESLNEVFPEWTDEEQQKIFNEYQIAFGEKMLAAGFEPVAFNFSQGNGRGEQWLRLYEGVLDTYKYLGFHEYDWPTMDRLHNVGLNGKVEMENRVPAVGEGRGNDGMWRALRYRRIMFEGIRQKYGDKHTLIITECGMTQGVWGGDDIGPWADHVTVPNSIPGGVVSSPIPEEDYWKTLLWYNDEIMKDDYVMGACLFVTGASGLAEWQTFEHLGGIMNRISQFQKVVPIDRNPTPTTPFAKANVQGTTAAKPVTETMTTEQPTSSRRRRPAANKPSNTTMNTTATKDKPQARPTNSIKPAPSNTKPTTDTSTTTTANTSTTPSAKTPQWDYSLTQGPGLPLLIGDIGTPNETIQLTKPNGWKEQLTSGSKPEHGQGGFETYANLSGTYRIQFKGADFRIPLNGRLTRISFKQTSEPPPEPEPVPAAASGKWVYTLSHGPGLPLLVGDIGIPQETLTVTKPNGWRLNLTSGSKPEFGEGGFELYADQSGTYQIEFMDQTFHIPLTGQFTKVIFEKQAGPESVAVQVALRDRRTTYKVGERVFVTMAIKNLTKEAVPFGVLGLLTNTGHFQTSWDNGIIMAGDTFQHEDGLSFSAPGQYTIQLSVCFSSKANCLGPDGEWERFEPPLRVMVQ
ncbi:MAG: hypothetical protein AAF629_36790 [Chloroflexota bacterium]